MKENLWLCRDKNGELCLLIQVGKPIQKNGIWLGEQGCRCILMDRMEYGMVTHENSPVFCRLLPMIGQNLRVEKIEEVKPKKSVAKKRSRSRKPCLV